MKNNKGFTLVEVLLVLVLISCGLLPIYSLIRNGQQRITRADSRTLATVFGASALELCRSVGYDRAQKIDKDDDFMELQHYADKSGYEIIPNIQLLEVQPLPEGAKKEFMVHAKFYIRAKHKKVEEKNTQELVVGTLLTNSRDNFY